MLSAFLAVAYKEILHVLRDPSTRFVFLIPIFQLTLFGYAIDLQVVDVPVGVTDLDETIESRELRTAMDNTDTLEMTRRFTSLHDLEDALVKGDVRAGLYIPTGFARALHRGEASQVLLLVDGSYSTEANAALSTAEMVASRTLSRVQLRPRELADFPGRSRIDLRGRFLFNPELRTPNFFVPGLVGIIMQLITVLLTAFSIVREKELGTFEQLMVTPVGAWSLILGKLTPYFVIAMIQTCLVLLAMVYIFAVPIHGSVLVLLTLSMLFVITSLSLGVIISTLSSTQTEAMQFAMLTLLPSILLSGFVFPLQSIPDVLQPLTYVIPARYFIEILRGVIVRGASLHALWIQAAALAAYTVVLLFVGVAAFRKRVD